MYSIYTPWVPQALLNLYCETEFSKLGIAKVNLVFCIALNCVYVCPVYQTVLISGRPDSLLFCIKYTFITRQNPLLDGGELTTYIGSVATKPGSADTSTSFSQWQKKGVGPWRNWEN